MRLAPPATLALSLPFAHAASGTFNVLSFNVAGLPEILNDNGIKGGKSNAARMIGEKFAESTYDIIHVQEDFNYHSELYSADTHPFRTHTSGPVPFGSGLNTLSHYNWTALDRITWADCDLNEADCLTPKGFTFMRLALAPDVTVDLYNLHMDAGGEPGDAAARGSNVAQVAAYVAAQSAGRAVLVFGDTNTLYARRPDDVRAWEGGIGVRDAWVEVVYGGAVPGDAAECGMPARGRECETLDKVLYRAGDGVGLRATGFEYVTDRFLQPDGNLLSDHNAVMVEFAWSTA